MGLPFFGSRPSTRGRPGPLFAGLSLIRRCLRIGVTVTFPRLLVAIQRNLPVKQVNVNRPVKQFYYVNNPYDQPADQSRLLYKWRQHRPEETALLQYVATTTLAIFAFEEGHWDRARATLTLFLGTIAGWYNGSTFAHTPPVVWVSIFWAMDWVLGSGLAISRRQWSPRKAFFSIVKCLVYLAALAVAFGLRESHMLGAWAISGVIEAGILCAEGSSVMRNGARLTGSRLLHWFADSMEARVAALEQQIQETAKENINDQPGK